MPDNPTTVTFGGKSFEPMSPDTEAVWFRLDRQEFATFTAAVHRAEAAEKENARLRALVSWIDGACTDGESTANGYLTAIQQAITRYREEEAKRGS